MLSTLLSLGALGLAAAVPLEGRQVVPHYPETKQSKGFTLVANVTDPSKDLNPPINHWRLASLHVGAGLGDAVLESDFAWTFYMNGKLISNYCKYKNPSLKRTVYLIIHHQAPRKKSATTRPTP